MLSEVFLPPRSACADTVKRFSRVRSPAAAARRPQLTKYRDISIFTLGMTPTKFTKAGAPAVSMEVLNDLAGDPFSVSAAVAVGQQWVLPEVLRPTTAACSLNKHGKPRHFKASVETWECPPPAESLAGC